MARKRRLPWELRTFVAQAIERVGSQERLAQLLTEAGVPASRRVVGGWKTGELGLPAEALLAIARVTGMSLDQASIGHEGDMAALRRQLEELQRQVEAWRLETEQELKTLRAWCQQAQRRFPFLAPLPERALSLSEVAEVQRRLLSQAQRRQSREDRDISTSGRQPTGG